MLRQKRTKSENNFYRAFSDIIDYPSKTGSDVRDDIGRTGDSLAVLLYRHPREPKHVVNLIKASKTLIEINCCCARPVLIRLPIKMAERKVKPAVLYPRRVTSFEVVHRPLSDRVSSLVGLLCRSYR